MVRLDDIIDYLKRRFLTSLKWPYLVGGFVLVALGQWVQYSGGLTPLANLFYGIVKDLGLIQPFSLIPIYFDYVSKCDYAAEIDFNCSPWRFIDLRRYFGGLLGTIGEVWMLSGWAGRVILPIAIIVGFWVSVNIVMSVQEKITGKQTDFNWFHVVAGALITPFVASILALVLQGLGMALFLLFGAAVSALIILSLPLAIWRAAKNAEAAGRALQQTVEIVAKGSVSPNSGDKPG